MEHVTSKFDPKVFYRHYNAHDFASLEAYVLPDIRVNGEVWGLARYQHRLEAVVAAFLDYQWHLDSLLADGDWLGGSVHRPGDTFGTTPRRYLDRSAGHDARVRVLPLRREQDRGGMDARRQPLYLFIVAHQQRPFSR